jgi:hypothetical protein
LRERPGKRTRGRRSDAHNRVFRKTYDRYLHSLGWMFHPTMSIGSGCQVHLRTKELPAGRLIVRLRKHVAVVIDGVSVYRGTLNLPPSPTLFPPRAAAR